MTAGGGDAGTFARFVATGATAALLFICAAFVLRARAGLPPFAASGMAYIVAFAFSYATQRRWTFAGRHSHRRAFPRYLAAQTACFGLSGALSELLGGVWGATPFVMALGTGAAVSAASFALSRFWVFAD